MVQYKEYGFEGRTAIVTGAGSGIGEATAIELATSYLLEALTGAWPWQTYTNYAIHFQGRIALSPSIRFGLGGLLFLYILQPLFRRLVGALPDRARSIVFWVLLTAFLLDNLLTILIRL